MLSPSPDDRKSLTDNPIREKEDVMKQCVRFCLIPRVLGWPSPGGGWVCFFFYGGLGKFMGGISGFVKRDLGTTVRKNLPATRLSFPYYGQYPCLR